ncbi:MAG: hypothetical protein KTV68_05195 [Acidimicrobiia bacterium]|nr:hypothetical protein [Acidimicrobiia bacterium]
MERPTGADPVDSSDAFKKLQEAQELYEDYLSIVEVAEQAALRELALWSSSEDKEPETGFRPQPLTISFRPSS